MILFVADDHFNTSPGKMIYGEIKDNYDDIRFYENDWSGFVENDLAGDCDLLILNMIADTCGNPLPGPEAEEQIKKYCKKGGSMLFLHGSSAAFWHWDWWRKIVGFRWVRPNDPDGVDPSTHPKKPFKVTVSKSSHPLCAKLRDLDLPEDEIYINQQQTCPASILMETHIEEGTFPQCYECATPWGGKIIAFIPGHKPEVTTNPDLIYDVKVLIDYLLEK